MVDKSGQTMQGDAGAGVSNYDAIPVSLRQLPQWVCWRYAKRGNDKPTKVPLNPRTLTAASTTDPSHWTDFATALAASSRCDGIGFVFVEGGGLVGIDFDECITEAGELVEGVRATLDSFAETYAEISPSKRGIKVWARGAKPGTLSKVNDVLGCKQIEMYDHGRYFTVTGERCGEAIAVMDAQEAIAAVYGAMEAAKASQKPSSAHPSPPAGSGEAPRGNSGVSRTLMPAESRCEKYLSKMPDAISGQGGHNRTLEAACTCYRFDLSDDQTWTMLQWFNATKCKPEWTDAELRHKMESAAEKVQGDERGRLLRESKPTMTRPVSVVLPNGRPVDDPVAAAKRGHPWEMRDWGNGQRLAYYHGGGIRFDVRLGRWRVWDGKRWALDHGDATILRLAADTAKRIFNEAAECGDPNIASMLGRHAGKSLDASKLQAMLKMAAAQEGITIAPKLWDADPFAFNCDNGIINLRTGELLPHDPARYFTKIAPVVFDPAATHPLWEKSLGDWLTDGEVLAFLPRAAGYSMTGDASEEKLFFVNGPTNSGKTTFCESVKAALGDYSTTARFDSFIKQAHASGASASGDIARLDGSRFVVSSEVQEGAELAEGLVKSLSGGEKITARHLYQSEFEFLPTFKLWLIANEAPKIDADDAAMWRRIIRIPFDRTIPVEQRDPSVKRRLTDPQECGPAVLAWLVRGCVEWQRVGLAVPTAVAGATEELREQMDVLGEFFQDRLEFGPRCYATPADLQGAYTRWCEDHGYRFRLGPKRMAAKLRSKGCHNNEKDSGGSRYWSGVAIRLGH